jgi:CDP-ribitol ribitolphosphotransferase
MKPGFYIKQILKQGMQEIYLPLLYKRYAKQQVQKGLVLFCDAHHSSMPFAMERMYDKVKSEPGYIVEEWITDFGKMGIAGLLKWLKAFMKRYAVAEYVFICDNFLPVASCHKKSETKVVQLWHSGGLLKKFGYDAEDDIPSMYKQTVYKNYDMLTVSAPCCVPVLSCAMRLPEKIAVATGISRTDYYFDKEWNEENRRVFFDRYKEAQGKKIILWAPTFRGNAGTPSLVGMDAISRVMENTRDEYFWIIKLHPHLEGKGLNSNCDIPSERLFAVADLLITDYSSILFDYMLYGKPFVLFAPDLHEYEKNRGFYVPYDSFPTTVVLEESELAAAISHELTERSPEDIRRCCDYHMAACDGHATDRILCEVKNI